MTTKTDQLLSLVRRRGMVRPRDLEAPRIPRIYLTRLRRDGLLVRPWRGVYVLPDSEPTEFHGLAEVCKRLPHGVVCLLSALRFHGPTTQAPFEVVAGHRPQGPPSPAGTPAAPRRPLPRPSPDQGC